MSIPHDNQDGFVALVSAIVIAALLIIIGASLGYTGFFSRFNILDTEFKEASLGLAEACAEIARVEIANNSNFISTVTSAGKVYNIGDKNCTILLGSVAGSLQSQAIYEKSYSTIEAVYFRDIANSNVVITSWKEIP